MASNLNHMAHLSLREPFHIRRSVFGVEFTLSLPKGYSIFFLPLASLMSKPVLSAFILSYAEVVEFIPKGGVDKFKLFIQNKPNFRNAQNEHN